MVSHPFPRTTPEAVGLSPARLERIETGLQAEVAAGRLPGAVLAIARRGKLAYQQAFGYRDKTAGATMREDAIFSIASMTKPLVAVGALMLYEEGRLLVNEPVGKYLPRLADMRVAMTGDLSGKPALDTEPAARQATIQDLMRHTAGYTYGNRGSSAWHKSYPSSSDAVAENLSGPEFLDQIGKLPLHFHPGTAWDYSFGFDILGLAIESVTGGSLGAFLGERLFRPLGMHDTAFVVPPGKAGRYAKGLPCDPLTAQPQRIRDGTLPPRFECGGGCAVSTAADYLRFAQMLLDGGIAGGTRILGRKTVDFMTADHIGPEIDTTQLRRYPNIDGYGFGLGVAVRRHAGGAGTMSSPGEFHWAGSTGTYFWVDPREELVVVFMAHAPGALRFQYRQLLHALVLQAIV